MRRFRPFRGPWRRRSLATAVLRPPLPYYRGPRVGCMGCLVPISILAFLLAGLAMLVSWVGFL